MEQLRTEEPKNLGKRKRLEGEETATIQLGETEPSLKRCYVLEELDDLDVPVIVLKPKFLFLSLVSPSLKTQTEKELKIYERTREKNSNNSSLVIKILLKEVEILIKTNQFNIALEKLDQVIKFQSSNVEALNQRALCRAFLGEFEEALEDVESVLEKEPENLKALLNSVIIHYDGFKDVHKAEESLRIAARHHEKHPMVIGYAKSLKIDLTKLRESESSIIGETRTEKKSILRVSADFLFISGRNALRNGKTWLALEKFSLALESDENHIPSRISRANIYKDQGKMSEAKDDYQFVLNLSPDSRCALFGLACSDFILRNYDLSLQYLDRILSVTPSFINGTFLRGEIYRKLSRFTESLTDFNEVVQFFRRLSEVDHPLLSSDRGKKAYCRALTRRALVRYKVLGGAKAEKKDIEDVLQDFISASKFLKDDTFLYNTLAGIYLDMREYEKAFSCLEKCFAINPDDVDSLITIGRVYRDQRNFAKATESLKKAIQLKDNAVFAYYHLVGVYLDIKEYHLALETIDQILSFHKDDRLPHVKIVIRRLACKITKDNPS